MTLLPKSFILTNLVRNGLSNAARPLYATSAVRSVTSNSSNSAVAQEDENENSEFAKDYKNKVKFLERFGLIKPNISWPQYNRIIYPPSENGELMRNPFVHHMRSFIKYPAKKLWYPAFLIRGMSIDEALKQLSFHRLKGSVIIKDILLEAQELAVKQHNIEYKSNLWISYSSAIDNFKIKGVRKHRAYRFGQVEYKYSTYYVRLEEGQPPADYHVKYPTYEERVKEHIESLRKKTIHLSI